MYGRRSGTLPASYHGNSPDRQPLVGLLLKIPVRSMAAYHTGIRYRARLRNVDGPIPENRQTSHRNRESGKRRQNGPGRPHRDNGNRRANVVYLCLTFTWIYIYWSPIIGPGFSQGFVFMRFGKNRIHRLTDRRKIESPAVISGNASGDAPFGGHIVCRAYRVAATRQDRLFPTAILGDGRAPAGSVFKNRIGDSGTKN